MSFSNTSDDTNHTSFTTINDDENEDEIKRYSKDKEDGSAHVIAVFEGDYVRFARELNDGKLADEKIVLQEEFEKIIEQEGWRKEQDE